MEYIFKKVLIVGDANCGKTSLASAFIQSAPLDEEDEDPLGAVSKVVPVDVDGTEISLVLTNISGKEDEESMRCWTYSYTDVILMCYSIDDPQSFLNIREKWKPEMQKYFPCVPTMLVGNKTDLRNDDEYVAFFSSNNGRLLDHRDGIRMVEKLGVAMYIECSAKNDDGVKEVFEIAARIASQRDNDRTSPTPITTKFSSTSSLHSFKADVTEPTSKTILLVGDANCGKKSLMSVFIENKSLVEYQSNFVDSVNRAVPIKVAEVNMALTLRNISGLENLDRIRIQTYTSVDAVVICFAINNHKSFMNTKKKWLPEIMENFPEVPIVLAGTKKDLRMNVDYLLELDQENKKLLDFNDSEQMSEEMGVNAYVECSAMENDGVREVFEAAALAACKQT